MKQTGGFFKVLRGLGRLIPGEWLRTWTYLNLVYSPRKFLRATVGGFYRMDHIYEVLKEFTNTYQGRFSILEFGVAGGYSFAKHLMAIRYLGLEDRVMLHGFDTFDGLPPVEHEADAALIQGDEWIAGHYRGDLEWLDAYCQKKGYGNYQLHKGLFEDVLTPELLDQFQEWRPMLIWMDCDYYSSTRTALERVLQFLPSGCVIYFDDIYYNFSSTLTGQMKLVREVNQGLWGDHVELVPDLSLSWDSQRIYRFINLDGPKLELQQRPREDPVRRPIEDSPFP